MKQTLPILSAVMIALLAASGTVRGADWLKQEVARYRKELADCGRQLVEMKARGVRTPEQKKALMLKEGDWRSAHLHLALYERELNYRDSDEDLLKGVSNVCPVHHRPMVATRVAIEYGMPAPSAVPWKQFPFARDYAMGGCCETDMFPTHAKIYICPDCVAAEKKWLAAHKNETVAKNSARRND